MSREKEPLQRQRAHHRVLPRSFLLAFVSLLLSSYLALWLSENVRIEVNFVRDKKLEGLQEKSACRAPLPTLLASHPPRRDAPGLKTAAASLHEFLSARTCGSDIDSLSIAVVTPAGPVFEGSYGVLRANESEPAKRGSVTRDSIYRIASITKMFTVLETLILRERGFLNWDDPVTKFISNFTIPSYGWADYLRGSGNSSDSTPVTLRQLASHLSGIGRDYPPYDVGETWPGSLPHEDPNSDHYAERMRNATKERLLDVVAKIPLVAPQYTFPIYSNTGMDILGLCNVAAYEMATGKARTHGELLKDDIFDPLGLNSSFYRIPNGRLAAQVAVPSSNSKWADLTFSTVDDASGGQFSSLADLSTTMQSFLSPTATGVVSPYVMREWLRPLHAWSDGFQEVGAPWEIVKIGREARLYTKGGNLPGYHSQFVLNPQWSYGVIVLVAGNYTDTGTLAQEAISRFQPAFEKLLLMQVFSTYCGVWVGDDSVAVVTIESGALYLQTLIVGNSDVLGLLQRNPSGESSPMALWSTGRPHEFRLAIGRSELNGNPDAGCEPYWISIDYPTSRGAPLDLLLWDRDELVYPSAGVRLQRA